MRLQFLYVGVVIYNMKQSGRLIFRVIVILMVLSLMVAIFLIASYLVSLENDPYTSFFKRIQPIFYLRAALILLISSLLYIPISYGISYYFLQSRCRNVGFSDMFYIFKKLLSTFFNV